MCGTLKDRGNGRQTVKPAMPKGKSTFLCGEKRKLIFRLKGAERTMPFLG